MSTVHGLLIIGWMIRQAQPFALHDLAIECSVCNQLFDIQIEVIGSISRSARRLITPPPTQGSLSYSYPEPIYLGTIVGIEAFNLDTAAAGRIIFSKIRMHSTFDGVYSHLILCFDEPSCTIDSSTATKIFNVTIDSYTGVPTMEYLITVTSSDDSTDLVYIKLYGETGIVTFALTDEDSATLTDLPIGTSVTFSFTSNVDVGTLYYMKLSKFIYSTGELDRYKFTSATVEILPAAQTYNFDCVTSCLVCTQDCQITANFEHNIFASSSAVPLGCLEQVTKVFVHTGTQTTVPTSATLTLNVIGSLSSGIFILSGHMFSSTAVVEEMVSHSEAWGPITQLDLTVGDLTGTWEMQKIIIIDYTAGYTYEFPCSMMCLMIAFDNQNIASPAVTYDVNDACPVPTTIGPSTVEETTIPDTTLPLTTVLPTTLPETTLPPTTEPPTTLPPTTEPPTTLPPTTEPPTTLPPTTELPTTLPPTTDLPTTLRPTTELPTTLPPTTLSPTTELPTTLSPTTELPTTLPPTTELPTTLLPTTELPTTLPPTTELPTTLPPTTELPTTLLPTTSLPTTLSDTTELPTTEPETTELPTTVLETTSPTTEVATSELPTTIPETTETPTTESPTTEPQTTEPQTTEPQTTLDDKETTEDETTSTTTTFYNTTTAVKSGSVQCPSLASLRGVVTSTHLAYPGVSVEITCINPWRFSDGTTKRTMNCGLFAAWDMEPQNCHEVLCPPPPTVSNSYVVHLDRSIGATITYRCIAGHRFYPAIYEFDALCTYIGWQRVPIISCERVYCPLFTVADAFIDMDITDTNIIVTVTCKQGYGFSDGSTARTVICIETGQWNTSPPKCKAQSCNNDSGRTVKYGDIITESCPGGSIFTDGQSATQRMCGTFGRWSREISNCEVDHCPVMPYIPHSFRDGFQDGTFRFNCDLGYRFPDGTKKVIDSGCYDTVIEYGRMPYTCINITCSQAPSRKHVSTNTSLAIFGTHMEYRCDYGYIFPDRTLHKVIVCEDDGNWTNSVDDCQLTLCPPLTSLPDVNVSSDVRTVDVNITVHCDGTMLFRDGHRIKVTYCTEIGIWDKYISDCSENRCQSIPPPVNAVASSIFTDAGNVIIYACLEGYEFSNQQTTKVVKCENNLQWNDTDVTCEIKHCELTPAMLHLQDTATTEYGTHVNFTCPLGFLLPNGQQYQDTVCQDNGEWSSNFDQCEPVFCLAPHMLTNATVAVQGIAYEDDAIVWCHEGFRSANGSISTWSVCGPHALWEPPIQDCKELYCDKVPVWMEATFNSTDNSWGSVVNITCLDNYLIPPDQYNQLVTCQGKGVWHPPIEECELSEPIRVSTVTEEAPKSVNIGVVMIGLVGGGLAALIGVDVTFLITQIHLATMIKEIKLFYAKK